MKKRLFSVLAVCSLLFVGCDFIFNFLTEESIDFSVFGFSETGVVLTWSTERAGARFNIYVKDKSGTISCVEENYGKTNYFVESDNQSSYAVGIIADDIEIFKTSFVYPDLKAESGFPVHGEISDDGYLGVEFLYPSNVEKFSLNIKKENSNSIIPTSEYPAEEMKSYLFPLRYEKNSRNNYFTVIFRVGEKTYISSPYYFDYSAEEKAKTEGFVTFYPSL